MVTQTTSILKIEKLNSNICMISTVFLSTKHTAVRCYSWHTWHGWWLQCHNRRQYFWRCHTLSLLYAWNWEQFVCTPQHCIENMKSTNLGHLDSYEYYEHNDLSTMENPSQKSMVNENKAQVANRKCEANAPIYMMRYWLSWIFPPKTECPYHTKESPHFICEFVAETWCILGRSVHHNVFSTTCS